MKIIGLTGFKRSGKNTFANMLKEQAEERGYSVHLAAYADKLKLAGARALGFERTDQELIDLMDQFKEDAVIRIEYTEEGARKGTLHELTGREYLQFLGTEAGRQVFGQNFWIDQVTPMSWATLTDYYPKVDLLIVTDVRFDNEALRIASPNLAGTVIEVTREGYEGDGHASEAGVTPELVDYVVTNFGLVENLRPQADIILNKVMQ